MKCELRSIVFLKLLLLIKFYNYDNSVEAGMT